MIRIEYDSAGRTVSTFDEAGTLLGTRAYTTEENAAADADVLAATQDANRLSIEGKLDAAMVDVQTLLDTANATINSGPAPYIKTLGRVARLLIRLARRKFDGTA